MSPQSKILIAVLAIAAFIVGSALNRPKVDNTAKVDALLSAELLLLQPGLDDQSVAVRDHLGTLTMINFWATWCAPCRQEMPLFETMYQLNKPKGFNVVGIAIDTPTKAQPFLDSMGISYPILYATQTGMVLMEESGNPAQLLPYTLLVDKDGNVLEQKIGQVHEADINTWIATHLQ